MINNFFLTLWYNKKFKLFVILLSPLSLLWICLVYIRRLYYFFTGQLKSNKFVICIGNITVGGGGKTPVVIALVKKLQDKKLKAVIIKKNYQSNNKDIVLLSHHNYQVYNAFQYGDEAVLLSKYADVLLTNNWKDGFKFLENSDYDIIVMDDGLQNNSVYKDYSVLVVDYKIRFGNGFLLPVGPLRTFLNNTLNKVCAVLLLNTNSSFKGIINHKCIEQAQFRYIIKNLNSNRVIGFCGLAVPSKFLDTLKSNNLEVIDFIIFKDHHRYSMYDIDYLNDLSKKNNAQLICTVKDLVKLKDYAQIRNLAVVEQELELGDKIFHDIISKYQYKTSS